MGEAKDRKNPDGSYKYFKGDNFRKTQRKLKKFLNGVLIRYTKIDPDLKVGEKPAEGLIKKFNKNRRKKQ